MKNNEVHPYAIFTIACLMMQESIDMMPGNKGFAFKVKRQANILQKQLEPYVNDVYTDINKEAEQGLIKIWNLFDFLAKFTANLRLTDVERVQYIMESIQKTDETELSGLLAVMESYFAGEVYEAKTPELMEKFIEQKRITKVNAA